MKPNLKNFRPKTIDLKFETTRNLKRENVLKIRCLEIKYQN